MASVVEQVPFNRYTGNGVATAYSFEFQLLSADDLVVKINGTETTSFSLAGVGNQAGGTVTFLAAPASGADILISRAIDLERDTEYQYSGDFLASTVNRDFNRLWQAMQERKAETVGAIRLPYPEVAAELVAQASRLDKLLSFDAATGQPEMTPFTVTQVASVIAAAYAASALADAVTFTPAGDGAVSRSVQAVLRERWISAKDYGVVAGDSSPATCAANTIAFNKALTAAAGRVLFIPAGAYWVSGTLTVPNRTTIVGDGPMSSQLYYRTTSTTVFNYLFYFNNCDNIRLADLGLVCDKGAGSQHTIAIYANGDAGSVTELDLQRVYIDSFQRYGIYINQSVYYPNLERVRVLNTSNSVANGGTAVENAIAIYFGSTVNAINILKSRISSNDVAFESATTQQKYGLNVAFCFFENNGLSGSPTEYDTVSLKNWSSVNWIGNYCENNLTGTGTADSFLKLRACRGVNVQGGLIAGSYGGVARSKNLIGISDSTTGVSVENVELQDPITKWIYVADGNSIVKAERNHYVFAGSAVSDYAGIMSHMTAALVEIDVPLLVTVNTGTIASAGKHEVDITMAGVPTDRKSIVVLTPQASTAEWNWSYSLSAADTVHLVMQNLKGSNHSFNNTFALRCWKHGSF